MACPGATISAASTAMDILMGNGWNCVLSSVSLNFANGNPNDTPSTSTPTPVTMFALRPMDHLVEGGKAIRHLFTVEPVPRQSQAIPTVPVPFPMSPCIRPAPGLLERSRPRPALGSDVRQPSDFAFPQRSLFLNWVVLFPQTLSLSSSLFRQLNGSFDGQILPVPDLSGNHCGSLGW